MASRPRAIVRRANLDADADRAALARVARAAEAGALRRATTARRRHRGLGVGSARAAGPARQIDRRATLMRERGLALLLALGALAAFYGLWLRPAPSLDPEPIRRAPPVPSGAAMVTRRCSSGWSGPACEARSWRERYTALADADIPPRGNLWCSRCRAWRCSATTNSPRWTSGCDAETRCSSMRRCWISRAGQSDANRAW